MYFPYCSFSFVTCNVKIHLLFISYLLQAEPPQIVVATVGSLCQMIEKNILKLEAMRILVIDEVFQISSYSFL